MFVKVAEKKSSVMVANIRKQLYRDSIYRGDTKYTRMQCVVV